MSSNIFKVSLVAATVAASFGAHAALYNVYLQDPPEGTSSSLQTYGVAVAPNATNCWSSSCSDSTSEMAIEVKRYREGFQYRDESPFFLPYGWTYLDDNYDGFRSYCRSLLGYSDSLCDDWANKQYTQGYANEQGGNYAGSIAYLNLVKLPYDENTVVNSINASGDPVGNVRNGSVNRNVAFVDADNTNYKSADSNFLSSHAWVSKTLTTGAGSRTFTVGSITRNNVDPGNINTFTSKPTIWLGTTATEINWAGNRAENGDYKAQGSVRDIVLDSTNSSKLYGVGYTSDGDVRSKAAVFVSSDSGDSWSTGTLVTGFPYDTSEYANQTLQAVNAKGIAIGTAKLNQALNGAYANTLFYVDNLTSPVYKAFSGSIFFSGANGKAGGINNVNDVVGTIDYERHKETNGKPRAKRAFITNLGAVTAPGLTPAPIGGIARYLDDLTYGSGASTDNNQYRIIEAADINDAGIIAATAYYCAGGFDSEAIDATCNAGASLVGVKLVPINGQTATDINTRPVTQETVERQGGTIGFIALTLLGFLGFRRK
ncbi:DUF3466 family protein [Vibrio sinaloensis]|uniref:DUF3466 family protein n=1 Tax=Photobacterium sp. (strain ATCC 43367) TaxID=379097 RepID=UPI0022AF13DF|nr:DUF3466 family protein [Vibrio sinaloensis]MCZ4294518.1 DUF3466 family protein [Vibrio sinaloensis]